MQHLTVFVCLFFAEVIKEKGLENVTVEDLVAGITPKGRGIFNYRNRTAAPN